MAATVLCPELVAAAANMLAAAWAAAEIGAPAQPVPDAGDWQTASARGKRGEPG